jgi:hypothetical protein
MSLRRQYVKQSSMVLHITTIHRSWYYTLQQYTDHGITQWWTQNKILGGAISARSKSSN